MSEPVLVALLFTDRIITEDNGKKGLIGVFQRVHAKSFPTSFPPWSVYAAITNTVGAHSFQLVLKSVEDGAVIVPLNGNFHSGSPEDVVELAVTISGALFPRPGKYVLSLDVEGERLGTRILYVQTSEEK